MAYKSKLFGYDVKDEAARNDLSEVGAYIGYPDDNVLGLEADFENSTFNRLGAARGLNAGSDFNQFNMYGERKLCNLADDGTITAWYGDPNYTETGYTTITDPETGDESTIQVQVMVRQPKFYYKVVPIKLEPITSTDPTQTGVHGYSGVKMNYYISDKPLPGFKLHPAFVNANGDEVDCYYIGAYEACLFDVSEDEYRLYDTWQVTYDSETGTYTVVNFYNYMASTSDKLSSITGVKPAAGNALESTSFISANVNGMAQNRGTGWHNINIKIIAAEQLLASIEYASFNSQISVGRGAVDYQSGTTYNLSAFTGATAIIGNGSGEAIENRRLRNSGDLDVTTDSGRLSIRYRGVENLWGNVHSYISGINIYYGSGDSGMGEPYICDDFDYAESKVTGNYKPIGFTLPRVSDYIKYYGYSEPYDWVLLPTKIGSAASSSVPTGNYYTITGKPSTYLIILLSGYWSSGSATGETSYEVRSTAYKARTAGARLCYV